MVPPRDTATSFVPSAEEATAVHDVSYISVGAQVAPRFVEIHMPDAVPAATSFVPSAEQATPCQHACGRLVMDHVWEYAGWLMPNPAHSTAKTVNDVFMWEIPFCTLRGSTHKP